MLYENSQESCVITKKFAVCIAFRKKNQFEKRAECFQEAKQ